jgi:hypothetical protein
MRRVLFVLVLESPFLLRHHSCEWGPELKYVLRAIAALFLWRVLKNAWSFMTLGPPAKLTSGAQKLGLDEGVTGILIIVFAPIVIGVVVPLIAGVQLWRLKKSGIAITLGYWVFVHLLLVALTIAAKRPLDVLQIVIGGVVALPLLLPAARRACEPLIDNPGPRDSASSIGV